MLRNAFAEFGEEQTDLGNLASRVALPLALAAAALLSGAVALGRHDVAHLARTYLASYCFLLSLALGGLFFVIVQHLVRAGWSVTVRRLAELLAATMPALAVLFLPVLASVLYGTPTLYAWADAEAVAHDPLLEHKAPYLNAAFFAVRALGYFALWVGLARFFLGQSLAQDQSGDPALTRSMERASPVAAILFGVSLTFAAFDWLMSLDPHWFSTIYGVYYFAGAAVGGLSAMILMAVALQAFGRLTSTVTTEHYHDLGKLLFGFVVFWGYIAFSQYLLIWYGNMPEETVWYLPRTRGPWAIVSLALLFGHLLLPFLGLMSRHVKRQKWLLAGWAAWLLAFHWLDLYWLVMPGLTPKAVAFGAVDGLCLAGLGAAFLAVLAWTAGQRPLRPLKDPRLAEAVAFENL